MKKSLIILTMICVCLVSFSLFVNNNVNAVSYYNWIKNSGFEVGANFIEDSSFESGLFNSGINYGNWSKPYNNGVGFGTTYIHSGIYALGIYYNSSSQAWVYYNLTTPILGNNIERFSFWDYQITPSYNGLMRLFYSDGTYDSVTLTFISSWRMENYTNNINDAKYLTAFGLTTADVQTYYIDDFQLIVNGVDSQQTIEFNSTPWFRGGINDSILLELNPYFGYNSNSSVAVASDAWNWGIIQNIEYLDSDTIHFIDMYARSDGNLYGLKVNIVYSDRSYTSKIVNSTYTTTWQHHVFSGFITPNKYIIQIQILGAWQFNGVINIDDVGIWSSLKADMSRFTWTTTPLPQNKTFFSGYLYQNTQYTFYGSVYDENGTLTEEGTYTVSHSTGSLSGNMVNGLLSFSMPKRQSTATFSEEINIIISVGVEQLEIEITIYWVYVYSLPPAQEERANNLIDWIVMFVVIFLPAILLGGALYENNQQPDAMHINPIYGVIAGLVLSIGVGVYTTVLPLWLLVLMIVAVVIIMVGMLKK